MFATRGLAKAFGALTALHPVDLEIAPATTVAIVGPSGSGKSTLLRLLAGLDEPSSGAVAFNGAQVSRADSNALRRRLGYVVQGGGLFPHLTARRNVTLLAEHLGWSAARRRDRVDTLARLVRLSSDTLERYPVQLSGGQAQRVSLMRALMLDPEVLLLDEPLGALDPITRYDLQTDLREIFRRLRRTVVMVTHDLGEAVYFADRVILMHEGRVEQDGPPADLIERPVSEFARRFVQAQRPPAPMRAPE